MSLDFTRFGRDIQLPIVRHYISGNLHQLLLFWTPFFGGWGQCFQVPVTLYVGDSRKENCPRPIAASFPVERELPNSTYGRVGFLDPQFPKFRTEMVRSDGTDFNFGDGRLSGGGRRLDVSNYLHPAGFPRQSRCSCQEEA